MFGFVNWTEIFNGRPFNICSIFVVQELKYRDDKDILLLKTFTEGTVVLISFSKLSHLHNILTPKNFTELT